MGLLLTILSVTLSPLQFWLATVNASAFSKFLRQLSANEEKFVLGMGKYRALYSDYVGCLYMYRYDIYANS